MPSPPDQEKLRAMFQMNKTLHYFVWLLVNDQRYCLLWHYGDSALDLFATYPKTSKLLIAKSNEQLTEIATKLKLVVSDEQPQIINLNLMREVLKRLRPSRSISIPDSNFLLETWNALEDLARSAKVQFLPEGISDSSQIDLIYEKLFHGNNLPSMTPAGSSYRPIFDATQLKVMRLVLRFAAIQANNVLMDV